MILNIEQLVQFKAAAKPLMEWLKKEFHPHVVVVVDSYRATIAEESATINNEKDQTENCKAKAE